jgi:Tfp pilus assembly protein PilN
VKPIHLNLASRPYRDYRPVYAAVVVISLLTAFLMLNNIETYYRYTHETSNTRAKIAELETQIRQEKQRKEIADGQLRSIDLATLDAKTRFINTKLAERAFSWSTLLDEMESVIADDVRLLSIRPSFQPDGTVALDLSLESRSPDGMITTINKMNADPQFSDVFPRGESLIEGGSAFDLVAKYQPRAIPAARNVRSTR